MDRASYDDRTGAGAQGHGAYEESLAGVGNASASHRPRRGESKLVAHAAFARSCAELTSLPPGADWKLCAGTSGRSTYRSRVRGARPRQLLRSIRSCALVARFATLLGHAGKARNRDVSFAAILPLLQRNNAHAGGLSVLPCGRRDGSRTPNWRERSFAAGAE
jgi:hypothetical protein